VFLSLSSWIYSHLPAEQMLRRVRECGYDSVEISGGNWPARWAWPELQAAAARRGVRITSVHCCHHEMPDEQLDDETYRAYHETFYANLTDAEGVIVVEHESHKFNETVDVARAAMLQELGAEHGLAVTFENMAAPPEQLEKLVRLDGVRFTFDPMHAAELAHLDPLCYKGLFDRLVNVHAMDTVESAPLGHAIPCGLGELGWPTIIQALADSGYPGPVTVEMQVAPVRRVVELCKPVVELAYGPAAAEPFAIEVEDTFAIYARKYLERQIEQTVRPS